MIGLVIASVLRIGVYLALSSLALMLACLQQTSKRMHDVPYHNFRHVVDVTHSCYCFLRLTEGNCLFSVWEQVSLLVAALCHDLEHPGKYVQLETQASSQTDPTMEVSIPEKLLQIIFASSANKADMPALHNQQFMSMNWSDCDCNARHPSPRSAAASLFFKSLAESLETWALKAGCEIAGVNNAFLIATRHELAQTYNDSSVLESHHLATLYRMMSQPELDIFQKMDASKWREVRKHIINAVIHTDMTYHFPLVSKVGWRPRESSLGNS